MAPQLQVPPALLNDEILREICGFLSLTQGNRALSALARSCTSFSEPALDSLWRNMSTLIPFLRLFPTFTRIREDDTEHQVYILGRVMDDDMSRFQTYADRVRAFSLTLEPGIIHPSVLPLLSFYSQGRSLFPRLEDLNCSMSILLMQTDLLSLMSPSLQSFSISIGHHLNPRVSPSNDLLLSGFLGILTSTVPHLISLGLYVHTDSRLMSSLSAFTHLKRLHILTPLTAREMTLYLADLTALVELEIFTKRGPPAAASRDGFPSLRNLEVHGDFHCISGVLSTVAGTLLESLTIDNTMSQDNWDEYQHFMDSLTPSALTTSLTKFFLDWHTHAADEETEEQLTQAQAGRRFCEMSAGLLQMHALLFVELSYPPDSVRFMRDDVSDIAKAWPNIVNLTIACAPCDPIPLGALSELALHCPLLNKLSLPPIDSLWISASAIETYGGPPHNLQELDIYDSGMAADPDLAARFLMSIFPQMMLHVVDFDNEKSRSWDAVRKAVLALRGIPETQSREASWPSGGDFPFDVHDDAVVDVDMHDEEEEEE